MPHRNRRTPRRAVHPPDTALRADASFDSILRYPGLGVTACAAAAGVDVCAGACAHVRGSAVVGGVDTNQCLNETYADTHYQISARVGNMTGMPVLFVHKYWQRHTYLTAQRLITSMYDVKFKLLVSTPRNKKDAMEILSKYSKDSPVFTIDNLIEEMHKTNSALEPGSEQSPIPERYASFLKDTDIPIHYLFGCTDEMLEDLELEWLSQQTGFTVRDIQEILRKYEQGNDADMSNLAKLRTKKQQMLLQKGLESMYADILTSSNISIEDIMRQYTHTGGAQCRCPYPSSPWGGIAPASAGLGVFACVPTWDWHKTRTRRPGSRTHKPFCMRNGC